MKSSPRGAADFTSSDAHDGKSQEEHKAEGQQQGQQHNGSLRGRGRE